jgi:hypothetical protein
MKVQRVVQTLIEEGGSTWFYCDACFAKLKVQVRKGQVLGWTNTLRLCSCRQCKKTIKIEDETDHIPGYPYNQRQAMAHIDLVRDTFHYGTIEKTTWELLARFLWNGRTIHREIERFLIAKYWREAEPGWTPTTESDYRQAVDIMRSFQQLLRPPHEMEDTGSYCLLVFSPEKPLPDLLSRDGVAAALRTSSWAPRVFTELQGYSMGKGMVCMQNGTLCPVLATTSGWHPYLLPLHGIVCFTSVEAVQTFLHDTTILSGRLSVQVAWHLYMILLWNEEKQCSMCCPFESRSLAEQ